MCVYIYMYISRGFEEITYLSFKSKGTVALGRRNLCEEGI